MDDDVKAAWVRETVDAWEGRLVAYARRFLAGDVERARDVVQDTFLRLWQAERAEVEDHLGRWLYTVCRRRAIDVHRKDGRMVTSGEQAIAGRAPTGATPRAEFGDAPATPDEAAADRETTGQGGGLLTAVATLPPRQQEAVRLRFQGGLSYADMAGVMETSVSNVGVLLHTAMRSLRDRMGETPGDANTMTGGAA
jgi:RNA polymerase sigma-70 factor (ECF subfamily)